MWNKNIGNLWKDTRWKKWQSWNLNGQPRKWISAVNAELKAKGYDPASKQDVNENYKQMLQLDESSLMDLWKNKDKPMFVRIIAKALLSGKGFDIVEKMLDRSDGRPIQQNEHTGKGGEKLELTKIVIEQPNEKSVK